MKRKIKFRGRIFDTTEWVYGSLIVYPDKEHNILTPRENHSPKMNDWRIDAETVGQFTGFTDCVTREIYEDDILHFARYGKNYTALVKWNDEVGAWCMQLRYEPRCGCRPLSEWLNEERLEVIGNIHDNPELFRKQNQ